MFGKKHVNLLLKQTDTHFFSVQISFLCVWFCSVRQVAVLGLFLSVLFSLYLVPLGMYSPCIKEAGTLGPAPKLIGHRGAPMVRPQNYIFRLFIYRRSLIHQF